MEDEELQVDPLFGGMTRTPVWKGVPYWACIMSAVLVYITFIVSHNPFMLVLYLVLHGILYAIGSHDPGVYDDVRLWLLTSARCFNVKLWKAKSFSPCQTKRYIGWD
jgi:type IV secretion system protein VirB3